MATASFVFSPREAVLIEEQFFADNTDYTFKAYCVFQENVSGLEQGGFSIDWTPHSSMTGSITYEQEAKILDFKDGITPEEKQRGKKSICYELTIQVPRRVEAGERDTYVCGTITLTLKANATNEGNAQVTGSIPVLIMLYKGWFPRTFNTETEISNYKYHAVGNTYDLSSYNYNGIQKAKPCGLFDGYLWFLSNTTRVANNKRFVSLIPTSLDNDNVVRSRILEIAFPNRNAISGVYFFNNHIYGIEGSVGVLSKFDMNGNLIGQINIPTGIHVRYYFHTGHKVTRGKTSPNEVEISDNRMFFRISSGVVDDNPYQNHPEGSSTKITVVNTAEIFDDFGNELSDIFLYDEDIGISASNFQTSFFGDNGDGILSIASTHDRYYLYCRVSDGAKFITGLRHTDVIVATDKDLRVIPEECFELTHQADYTDDREHSNVKISVIGNKLVVFTFQSNAHPIRSYEYDLLKTKKPVVRNVPFVFAPSGTNIALDDICGGAEAYIFDVGYEKPDHVSLSGSQVSIDHSMLSEETYTQIKLKGINKKGSTDNGSFQFYAVVPIDTPPVWKDASVINVYANSKLNMHDYVEDAESISLLSSPSGVSLSTSGILRVATTDGDISLRATSGTLTADKTYTLKIIQHLTVDNYTKRFRFKTYIAGIDVSADLDGHPSVQASLDPVAVNTYRSGTASFKLQYLDGKYDSHVPNNFWQTHSLNIQGYLASIEIYVETLSNGSWQKDIIFSGIIQETAISIKSDVVTVSCIDNSYLLKISEIRSIGVKKYTEFVPKTPIAELSQPSYQGEYEPKDTGLVPIAKGSTTAFSGKERLQITETAIMPQGVTKENVVNISTTQLLSQGGYLAQNPFAQFKAEYKNVSAKRLAAVVSTPYAVDLSLFDAESETAFLQSLGNVQFNVSNGKIQHIPVDWEYNPSSKSVYILLSSDYNHTKDQLVEYSLESGRWFKLLEFDAALRTVEIISSDFTTFYVKTCSAIKDRALFLSPVGNYEIFAAYDSSLPSADTKIVSANVASGAITTLIDSNNSAKPQIGIQYFSGAENKRTVYDWQAIRPEARGNFKFHNNHIYYRWASGDRFGIALTTTAGSSSKLFDEAKDYYYNHLNFAFDVDSSGNVYFVYCVATSATTSTLYVKLRTSDGTVTTLLTETVPYANLDVIDPNDLGGAFAGCHEAIVHNNHLYMIIQIQRLVEVNDYSQNPAVQKSVRTNRKTAGVVLYKMNLQGTATLTVIDKNDFIQQGPRSLISYDNDVYYAEMPDAVDKLVSFNKDIDSFSEIYQYNPLSVENLGILKRVNNADTVSKIGNIWFSDKPHRGVCMPIIEGDSAIYIMSSFGNPDNIQDRGSESSSPDNYQWVKYGRKIEYLFKDVSTQRRYELLADIAKKTDAILKIENNIVSLIDRIPVSAVLASNIAADTTTIQLSNPNKVFPSSGYVLIDNEIIKYRSITNNRLSGITRGMVGSEVASHSVSAEVTYLDTLIAEDAYLKVSFKPDVNRFYNVVAGGSLSNRLENENSISDYGEKIYSLDLGLGIEDFQWDNFIRKRYRDNLSKLRYKVNLTLKPSNYLKTANIVCFYFDNEIFKPIIITQVNYEKKTTRITGRSI